jgi:hypothetical protein
MQPKGVGVAQYNGSFRAVWPVFYSRLQPDVQTGFGTHLDFYPF